MIIAFQLLHYGNNQYCIRMVFLLLMARYSCLRLGCRGAIVQHMDSTQVFFSSIVARFTLKTLLVRKETGIHLMKISFLRKKNSGP